MELRNLTVEEYKKLIDRYGMEKVWSVICEELKNNDWKEFSEKFFSFDELGKLYEVGLAHTNKIFKKEMGLNFPRCFWVYLETLFSRCRRYIFTSL